MADELPSSEVYGAENHSKQAIPQRNQLFPPRSAPSSHRQRQIFLYYPSMGEAHTRHSRLPSKPRQQSSLRQQCNKPRVYLVLSCKHWKFLLYILLRGSVLSLTLPWSKLHSSIGFLICIRKVKMKISYTRLSIKITDCLAGSSSLDLFDLVQFEISCCPIWSPTPTQYVKVVLKC